MRCCSASEGGRDCYMTGSSRSSMLTSPCRSDTEAEAQPSPAANLLAEQVCTHSYVSCIHQLCCLQQSEDTVVCAIVCPFSRSKP